MKPSSLILSFTIAASALTPARAADGQNLGTLQEEQAMGHSILLDRAAQEPVRPKLDPKRIINQSSAFLKDREPAMTEEEAAVYERIATLLATNADLATRMLEGMVNEKERPSPAFEFILGNAYYAANQFDRAEALYRSAVERFPTFQRAWKNLGIAYYARNRFSDAAACFSKVVSLGDRDPLTFGLLGYSLEQQGDLVSAEMAYLQALAGDPANLDCKSGLLRIYLAGRELARAEPLARFLVKARPAEAHGWLDYASILLAEGRKVEAMVVLEEAGDSGVARTDEWELLGDLYAEQNLAPEAVDAYRKVLAAEPRRGEKKLLRFAQVLTATGRLAEAERTLAAVSDHLTPATRVPWLQVRTDLRLAQKRWTDARQEIDALLALDPLNGRALLALGRTYEEEGNLPRATLAYEAAGRAPGTIYDASVELANIEIQNRHFAKAAEHLERALSIQKTDALEDALARVKSLVPPEPAPH